MGRSVPLQVLYQSDWKGRNWLWKENKLMFMRHNSIRGHHNTDNIKRHWLNRKPMMREGGRSKEKSKIENGHKHTAYIAHCVIDINFSISYIWYKYDLDKSTAHPKFNPIGVRACGLQIIDSTFHVPGPSGIYRIWASNADFKIRNDECGHRTDKILLSISNLSPNFICKNTDVKCVRNHFSDVLH